MINKPSGLSPVKYLGGADWDGKARVYTVLAAVTNPIFPGDVVDLVANSDANLGIPAIDLATAGNPAVGVVIAIGTNPNGPFVNQDNLNRIYRPAGAQTQNYYALVVDDPNVIYEAQEDGVGGTIAAANANKNANLIYAAGSATSPVSGTMIDSSTVAVTATLNLKLLGLKQGYEGGARMGFGQYAKWFCMINNHRYRTGVAGI